MIFAVGRVKLRLALLASDSGDGEDGSGQQLVQTGRSQ
jgi:hypothetical protein